MAKETEKLISTTVNYYFSVDCLQQTGTIELNKYVFIYFKFHSYVLFQKRDFEGYEVRDTDDMIYLLL